MTVSECIKNFVATNNDGYKVYENYSGRDMFGRTCLGVIIKKGYSYMDFLVKLTQYLSDNNIDDTDLELEGADVDDLGLDTIVYFPRIES